MLSRLSGVTYPQSSERCTRIGILLKLRRSNEAKPVRVELVGELEGKPIQLVFHDDKRETTEAIRLAQDHAMKLAKVGDSFVETLEIHVHVETPQTFNVTLVDLPGLLSPAPPSDGPATVERIVKKYANMSGSLLLFIVPTDQDYGIVLGKDIVDPHADKTIYVLTKLDLLYKLGEEVAKLRLDKIVDETKQPRVMVLGKLAPGKEEAQTLGSFDSTLSRNECEIQLGCQDLGGVIEMRMCEHLQRQLPELRKAVLTARDAKNARKKALLVRDPRDLVLNVVAEVRKAIYVKESQALAVFCPEMWDAASAGDSR